MEKLFEYTIQNGEATVTKYLGGDTLTEVVIPDSFEGCPVTEIGMEAFCDPRYLNSLVDEDIGDPPRKYSVIEKLTIPNTVRVINEGAFEGLASVKDVRLPFSLEIIGDFAFSYWTTWGAIYIPNGVKKVGHCAFGNPLFTDVYIPPTVVDMDDDAFGESTGVGPSNYKINLHVSRNAPPAQMKDFPWGFGDGMGYHGFKMYYDYEEYDRESTFQPSPMDVLREDAQQMRGAYLEIPFGYKEIGYEAFSGRDDITKVAIPDSVTYISGFAFHSCKNLTEITIPDSVFHIDKGAFENCEKLSRVTICNKIATIYPNHNKYHAGAFKNCPRLTVFCPEDSFAYKYCQKNNIEVRVV